MLSKIFLLLRIVVSFHSLARPSCLTHLLWYSGPVAGFLEEEPEEAVGEPQPLVEWRADDVM